MNLLSIVNRYVPFKYRVFILPFVTILIVFSLSLTVGKHMVDKIISTRNEIETISSLNNALQAKNTLLSSLNTEELRQDVQFAVTAVPGHTPSLPALNTIRGLALARGIIITNFTVREENEAKKSARVVLMQITAYGNLDGILGLVNDIKGYSPLMKVSLIDISSKNNVANARITIESAWAPLPQILGKAETPLEPINTLELQVITQLQDLKNINGNSGGVFLSPSSSNRENPFEF